MTALVVGSAPTPESSDDWLKVGEAAHALQLSEKRIRVLADRGDLEMQRTKYGRIIKRSSVEEYKATPRHAGRPKKA